MPRQSPRFCLVVDNPLRDLEGLVLLGWQLARRGAEVFLVPMYDQGTAVLGLEPDAVVVNYARSTNRELLRTYADAGIAVSVLDTEGGIVDSLDDYATSMTRNGTVAYVDQMLMWGPLQHDAFSRLSGLPPERLALVGCPRMDFCSEPWRRLLPTPERVPADYVLVNTNFSLVNPRFSATLDDELSTTLHAGFSGWDADYLRQLAEETREGMSRVIATTATLARTLPRVAFVVRPHPFENPQTYEAALAGIPNIQVRLEGTVVPWVKAAAAVVHLNCGSAVEATLMGKPVINLEWLNTDTLTRNAPFPREISFRASSMDDVREMLSRALAGRTVAAPGSQAMGDLQKVQQWFYNGDGRAAERAAEALVRLVAGRKPPAKTRVRRRALLGAQRSRPILGIGDVVGKLVFGGPYRWFRNNVVSGSVARGTRVTKIFHPGQVSSTLDRLATVAEFRATARPVRWGETWIPGQARTSVAILAPRPTP